jgi:hypothetical protein
MNTRFLLAASLSLLFAVSFIHAEVQAQETITKGIVFSASVSLGQQKVYHLSENLSKNSFVILSMNSVSGEGKFTLMKGSKFVGEYSDYSESISTSPFKFQFYIFPLPENGTDYIFNVTNYQAASFDFSSFYDVADNLTDTLNYKSIPFEAGAVGYYADLERGDRLSLELTSPENAEFDLLAIPSYLTSFSGYVIPSMYNTFYQPSPKSMEFVTAFKAQYLIFVVSTTGSGNFTLESSHTGNPVEGSLEFLRAKIDTLNNLIDNLILICVVSFFVAASNLYLYLRLRKSIRHRLVESAKAEK